METKIPPPIVTLLFGLSIYFSRGIFQTVEVKYSFYIAILLLILGLTVLISAVRLFRKDKTTVNPLSPEQATKLVTDGIFFIALFCFYITKFQIVPEERAMSNLFSQDFDKYKQKTRRWI